MATGILGQLQLNTASSWASVYTVPAGKVATVNILVLNTNTNVGKFSVALSTQATTPLTSELIESNVNVPGTEVLERGGIVLEAGRKIFVQSITASPNFAITITGYEE